MKTNRRYKAWYRKYRAYTTALIVALSYLRLQVLGKVLGKEYYRSRVQKLHLKNAHRVKKTILELQGLFIKIGQLISILSNVLPEEFREPLESLQDKIPARSYATVAKTIEQELGKSPEQLFTTFEKEPLAAASIGQVHRATLGAEEVVVKIQHINIAKTSKADLKILQNIVAIHGFFMSMKGLGHLYEQVSQMIADELNYEREAEAMQQIRENLEAEVGLRIVIPEVFEAYSTTRMLTMRYCKGENIGHIKKLEAWNIDLEDLASRILELYCKMILVDGYYQADPHPGNILVNEAGEIILLDYGAVARLTDTTKQAIPELVEAILKDDTAEIVKALKKMGFITNSREAEQYMEKLLSIFRRFLLEEVEFNGMNFQEIKLKSGFGALTAIVQQVNIREVSDTVQIPKDYVLLYRAIMLLLGVTYQLAPTLNPIDVVKPYIENNLINKKEGLKRLIVNTIKGQVSTVLALPQDLHRFLKQTTRGETKVEIKNFGKGFELLWWLGQMIFFGTLAVGFASALWFFETDFSVDKENWLFGLFLLMNFFFLRAWIQGGKLKNKGSSL